VLSLIAGIWHFWAASELGLRFPLRAWTDLRKASQASCHSPAVLEHLATRHECMHELR
jgi:hypothetical protein